MCEITREYIAGILCAMQVTGDDEFSEAIEKFIVQLEAELERWKDPWALIEYVSKLEVDSEGLLDALVHSGYDPEDCIDCGGPPHNEYCRFWKIRHLLPFDMVLTGEQSED